MRKLVLALAGALLSTMTAAAATNPFVGTWKIDLSKSNFTGDTFTYSSLPNGKMHFSNGSSVQFDFGLDGKEYPDPFGGTVCWTKDRENAWNNSSKFHGKEMSQSHIELSDGGKTLTVKSHGTKPDGSSFKDESVYTRVGDGTGLTGKWKSTKVSISTPNTYIVSAPSSDTVRWEIPQYKETVEGKADNSDLPISGPTVPAGITLAIKMLGANKLQYTVKMNGKPLGIGVQTLSADGKSLTEVTWSPGKESEKQTSVFVKQ